MSRPPSGFALLLRLLPAQFRERYASEILDDVGELAADARGIARGWVWLRAGVDLLRVALTLRARSLGTAMRAERGTSLRRDLWFAARSLRRDRGVVILAISIIGLGIGASASVFSVVDTVLIRPLPFDDPERLVMVSNGAWGQGRNLSAISVQVNHVRALREGNQTFDDVAGYFLFDRPGDHTVVLGGEPRRATRLQVTENFLGLLGVRPALGRDFRPGDNEDGGPAVALVTWTLWQEALGGDPAVVGTAVTIDDAPITVVGVLPDWFDFPAVFAPGSEVDFFTPYPLNDRTNRQGNTLALVGRLASSTTPVTAEQDARRIAADADPSLNRFRPVVTPLRRHVSGSVAAALQLLSGAVGLVMLIVCANISNLVLARGSGRQREMAVRSALGASRGRLVQQLLTENLLLSILGGILGLGLAWMGTAAIRDLEVNVPLLSSVRLHPSALAFTILAAALTGLAVGVVPALRLSRTTVGEALKESGRGMAGGRHQAGVRSALVVSEVALACVLLVGTALLVRSLMEVLTQELGFEPAQAVALRVDPSRGFQDEADRSHHLSEALRRARAAPGISAAGLTDVLPMAFNRRWCIDAVDAEAQPDDACLEPFVRVVSEGYLDAMGIRLVAGRDLTDRDDRSTPSVMLVNEAMAEALWPGRDPLGRVVQASGRDWTVVGVTRGMRHLDPERTPGPELFLPIRQSADHAAVYLIARGPGEVGRALRTALRPLDPGLPTTRILPIDDLVQASLGPRRFLVLLLSGFAIFATILASLGIYGVISYSVAQRNREMGIRMALGATAGRLQSRVLGETLRLVALGVGLGWVGSWGLGHGIRGLLYEVPALDLPSYLIAPLLLAVVSLGAGWVPARRASRVDPAGVLNAEG